MKLHKYNHSAGLPISGELLQPYFHFLDVDLIGLELEHCCQWLALWFSQDGLSLSPQDLSLIPVDAMTFSCPYEINLRGSNPGMHESFRRQVYSSLENHVILCYQ